MSEKNNNQANTEATTSEATDLQAKLAQLKAEFEQAASTGTSSGSQLSEEDKALLEDVGFKGKGKNGYYFLTFKGSVVSKVERVQGSTFKGELSKTQGQRQAVALSEIKLLRDNGLIEA